MSGLQPRLRVTKPSTAVVLLQRDNTGQLAVRDANGNVRLLDDISVLHELLDDPSLPQVEDVNPDELSVEHAVSEAAKHLAPEPLRPFVQIGIAMLRDRVKKAGSAADTNRNFRSRRRANLRMHR
jgi:hypothetical protein